VSYIAALEFSERLAPTFGDTAPWNRFVAMLAIYCVTSFMIWTAFRLLSGVIDKVKLEAFDKQLGAMFGFAKGVLLCVAVTFFAVTLLPPAQGELIVGSQSGQYIVALLNKADAVVPPELHQVIDPYLEKVQERLDPNHQANWPSGGAQPSSGAPSTGWSLPGWPRRQQSPEMPKIQWPQSSSPPTPAQPAWPPQTQSTQTQSTGPANSVYGGPREPNPFPDPHSAERPASVSY
jgi:membrane protein required for colicin V production